MFVYWYFFRSSKLFRIFCNVLKVVLSCINICAGIKSLLHKFCRDHPRRKSNTSIKKRSPHQQHHIDYQNQHALRRCRAGASIIFAASPASTLTTIPTTNTPSLLLAFLVFWCQPAKQVRNFICRLRARAAA